MSPMSAWHGDWFSGELVIVSTEALYEPSGGASSSTIDCVITQTPLGEVGQGCWGSYSGPKYVTA